MATAATSLLGLALPVTGELSGTWGDTVNVSITALLDTAVAGTTTLSSDADVTLTTTTLAANQARQAIILWTAGGTVTRTITVPAQSKSYIVINKTSSSQSIKIVGAGPTTGVTIVAGTAAFVVWNGVDFVTVSVTSTTGVLPVANGGTGLASGTSGGVLAYTATGTLASSAALAASALVIGGGAGAAPSTTTTGTGVVTALGVNTGSAGAFVVNGGALGSPSSVGTMPAFTLGGTVSGGGNQINNVVIGTTTPLAGNFTTLTTSSTVTINGGTANGVGYLDGSKVLTTGSALTYNGTSFGVGSSDYGNAGAINLSVGVAGTTAGGVQLWSNTANAHSIQWGDGTTSSDPYRGAIEYAHTGDSMRFYTSAAEKMRLDSAGNLGLGVTPSAWTFSSLSIGGQAASFAGDANTVYAQANAYYNAGWKYVGTGYAGQYQIDRAVTALHKWYTAPSGTAGDPITFTQAMTLTAAGNLLVGLTSASLGSRFEVKSSNSSLVGFISSDANGTAYEARASAGKVSHYATYATSAIDCYHAWFTTASSGAQTQAMTLDASGNLGIGETSPSTFGKLVVKGGTINLVTDTAAQRRVSFWSQGNGNSENAYIQVQNDGATTNTGEILFATRNSSGTLAERARIDASGNLLVGATISGGIVTAATVTHRFYVNNNNDWTARFVNTNATSPYGLTINYDSASPNGNVNSFWNCADLTATRGALQSNGGLSNYSANNTNLSDRREKTNFAPAKSYLDVICAIPVQTFNYIDQNLETDDGLTLGVVAQDVQLIAPELVMESNWGSKEEPKMRLSIYQTDLQYALMKCIQEQQALITQLTARITALETA